MSVITLYTEKWALCYRAFDHGDTDTNMYVERYEHNAILQNNSHGESTTTYSFHNKLKCNPAYLNSRVNRRVDYLITVLLRMEEDRFFDRQRKNLEWKRNSREVKDES